MYRNILATMAYYSRFNILYFSPKTVKNKVMIYDIKNYGITPVYASESSYKSNIGYIYDEPKFYVNDEHQCMLFLVIILNR